MWKKFKQYLPSVSISRSDHQVATDTNLYISNEPAFEQFVLSTPQDSQERLIGMIAYVEWRIEHPGSSPNQIPDIILQRYRKSAKTLLLDYSGEYAEFVLNQELDKLVNDSSLPEGVRLVETRILGNLQLVEARILGNLQAIEPNLTTKLTVPFWLPVKQSIVASVLFSVGLFGIALLIRFTAPDSNPGQLIKFFFASEQYKLCVIDKTKTDGVDTKKCFP
ncbi:MAG: hypothetical protein VKL42_24315 [Snowella sp.]|nr:hypothetical protein [Snowella sp.]